MKKITLIFVTIIAFTFTASAEKKMSDYTNHIDTIVDKAGISANLQYYLGDDMYLTRDTMAIKATNNKRGVLIMKDARIFLAKGIPGVFDHVEIIGGRRVIWIKFKANVDGTNEDIAVPFCSNGNVGINSFAARVVMFMNKRQPYTYNGHVYEFPTSVSLQVPSKSIQEITRAEGILVKNK